MMGLGYLARQSSTQVDEVKGVRTIATTLVL